MSIDWARDVISNLHCRIGGRNGRSGSIPVFEPIVFAGLVPTGLVALGILVWITIMSSKGDVLSKPSYLIVD